VTEFFLFEGTTQVEEDNSQAEVNVTSIDENEESFSTPLAPERSRKSLIDTPGTRNLCRISKKTTVKGTGSQGDKIDQPLDEW